MPASGSRKRIFTTRASSRPLHASSKKPSPLDPGRADCWSLLTSVKQDLGESASVLIERCRHRVRLQPDWILPRRALVTLLTSEGECDEAERELRVLESIPPLLEQPETAVVNYYESCVTARVSTLTSETLKQMRDDIRRYRHPSWLDRFEAWALRRAMQRMKKRMTQSAD